MYVPLAETVRGFKAIIDGEMDDYPENAFFNVGTLDDVKKAGKLVVATSPDYPPFESIYIPWKYCISVNRSHGFHLPYTVPGVASTR